jgi:hypothetical protein
MLQGWSQWIRGRCALHAEVHYSLPGPTEVSPPTCTNPPPSQDDVGAVIPSLISMMVIMWTEIVSCVLALKKRRRAAYGCLMMVESPEIMPKDYVPFGYI